MMKKTQISAYHLWAKLKLEEFTEDIKYLHLEDVNERIWKGGKKQERN